MTSATRPLPGSTPSLHPYIHASIHIHKFTYNHQPTAGRQAGMHDSWCTAQVTSGTLWRTTSHPLGLPRQVAGETRLLQTIHNFPVPPNAKHSQHLGGQIWVSGDPGGGVGCTGRQSQALGRWGPSRTRTTTQPTHRVNLMSSMMVDSMSGNNCPWGVGGGGVGEGHQRSAKGLLTGAAPSRLPDSRTSLPRFFDDCRISLTR
jgi:hypothetical protein